MKTQERFNTPKISIIIPIYNREQYIQGLIKCIKEQSFQGYECIIIDDGSTDKTGILCDLLITGDERFIVKHISNSGVSHARNIGLDIARGKYITFVDSDDRIPIDYLERLLKRIETLDVDIVIGSFIRVYANGKKEKIEYPFDERIYTFDELMPSFARIQKDSGVFGKCWGKLFPRGIISGIFFDESLNLAEDFDFYLKTYPRINTVFFDNTCEYSYYEGAENSSVKVADDDIDYIAQLKICIHYKEFLEHAKCFCGENEQIVTEKIQNYLFFSILHSKLKDLHQIFREVHRLFKESGIKPVKMKSLKGIVLYCIYTNNECCAIIIMTAFRIIRKLMRGH